jgi:hypothetical protein
MKWEARASPQHKWIKVPAFEVVALIAAGWEVRRLA